MRFAILGADADAVEWAHSILAQRQHRVDWLCEVDGTWHTPWSETLRAAAPAAQLLSQWESLLDPRLVDAVLVATGQDEERRAEQLRKLVQAGVPLMVSHPVLSSMLVYYELEMIRGDLATPALPTHWESASARPVRGVLVPAMPLRQHPAVKQLATIVQAGGESPIGALEQLVCERFLIRRDRTSVVSQFTRDVDLFRALGGDFARVATLGRGDDPKAFGTLGAQLTSASGLTARWSVGPADAATTDRLVLHGERGRATLAMPPGLSEWTLTIHSAGAAQESTYAAWAPAAAALANLQAALAGEATEPTWLDATRSVEIAQTMLRSLAKGRVLDLVREEFSEEGTFKGTMAAWGCGLLIVTVVSLCAVLILLQLGMPLVQMWPYFLLAVLALFLVFQVLVWIVPRRGAVEREPELPHSDKADEV